MSAPRWGTKSPNRKSQITKEAPSLRLKKRRRKNTNHGRFPNPAPLLYIITAKAPGTGSKRMHYTGTKFSDSRRVKLYGSKKEALTEAQALVDTYAVLKRYRIAVADNRSFQ